MLCLLEIQELVDKSHSIIQSIITYLLEMPLEIGTLDNRKKQKNVDAGCSIRNCRYAYILITDMMMSKDNNLLLSFLTTHE